MAWSDLAPKIDSLLQGLGLLEAPEIFSIDLVPATLTDKTYCLWCSGFKGDKANVVGHLAHAQVKISVIYDMGNNDPKKRDLAVKSIEDIICTLLNPSNRSSVTRIMHSNDSKSRMIREEGFYVIYDLMFEAEYQLTYL